VAGIRGTYEHVEVTVKKNIGTVDRIIRVALVVPAALFGVLSIVSGVWLVVLGVVAGVLLITGVIGHCPVYHLFGWKTSHA
jgi:hypothetical protein